MYCIIALVLEPDVAIVTSFLNTRARRNSARSYCWQGTATASLISGQPGNVRPFWKTCTLVGGQCLSQCYAGSITILVIPLSLLWITVAEHFWYGCLLGLLASVTGSS